MNCTDLVEYYIEEAQWKHFPVYWPFVRGIHRWPVYSHHKGQWRGVLMFTLVYAWRNGPANNRDDGDLRRYRAHYDLSVMYMNFVCKNLCLGKKQRIRNQYLHNPSLTKLVVITLNALWPNDAIWRQRSGSTLVPSGNKPLLEPMLIDHQWSPVTFILGQFHNRCPKPSITKIYLKTTYIKLHSNFPGANELNKFVLQTRDNTPHNRLDSFTVGDAKFTEYKLFLLIQGNAVTWLYLVKEWYMLPPQEMPQTIWNKCLCDHLAALSTLYGLHCQVCCLKCWASG